MGIVFDGKDTVLFVGGHDFNTGTGDANAGGGATKTAWEGSLNKNKSKVMTSSGGVLSGASTWGGYGNACNITNNGDGKVRITGTDSYFANCSAGLIANISGCTYHTDGRYEVTDVYPGGPYIVIDLAYSAIDSCDVKVGGAFDSLQNAIDNSDPDTYNVTIYINKHTTLSSTLDLTAIGGNIANDSVLKIHGLYSNVDDMDAGGAYYQDPFNALENGVDTNKCIKLDGNNAAIDIVTITNQHNIYFENIYFTNSNQASGNNLIELGTNPFNIHFHNCKFDDAYYFFNGTSYGIYLDNCYFGNNYGASYSMVSSMVAGYAMRCVFNIENKTYGPANSYLVYNSCIFYKGTYALYYALKASCLHCVFYLQTGAGIYLATTSSFVSGHSNIFYLAAADDRAIFINSAGGTGSKDMVNCCVWSAGGQLSSNHVYSAKTSKGWDLPGAIEADPLFADAANYDFRLKPSSPCLNKGKKTKGIAATDDGDGLTNIGIWQRRSFLPGMK